MDPQERENLVVAIAAYRERWRLSPIRPEKWDAVLAWSERVGATAERFDRSRPQAGEGDTLRRFSFEIPADVPEAAPADA